MSRDYDVDDFYRWSKLLKANGQKDMRKRLHAGAKKAVKPVIPKARAAARARLPKAGGLNELVAKSPIRTQVRTSKNNYGVRITVGSKNAARSTNRGQVRHRKDDVPKEMWTAQDVPAGWFDDTTKAEEPAMKRDVQAALKTFVETDLVKTFPRRRGV